MDMMVMVELMVVVIAVVVMAVKIKCQLSIFMLFFSVLECLRYFVANSLLSQFTPFLPKIAAA